MKRALDGRKPMQPNSDQPLDHGEAGVSRPAPERGLKNAGGAGGLAADYPTLFDALPTPYLVLAPPEFVMVAANEAYLRVTTKRREDLLGRKVFEVFPDNPANPWATGVANVRASLERVLATRQTDVVPVQRYDIPRPQGGFEERWWCPVNIPVLGDDGSVRLILHHADDVTAEVRERRRADQAQAAEAHFRAVADAIPGLVFETDLEARNIYVNEQYRAYTGRPLEELLGHGWRQILHVDDYDMVAGGYLAALHTGRPFEFECRVRRADGAWRWFMVRTSMLRGADGGIEGGIGVCTDIHDAKRGETALREAQELQRTMLEEVSHRVKNSLALVSSVLKLQARTVDDGARHALEEAALRVRAVAGVHDQLWRGAEAREIDLKAFLRNLCKAVATSSPRHRTSCDAEPAFVSADVAAPLGLLINELLTNAYKHAYPEGEEGEVRLIGVRAPDGRYRVEVVDRGRGLPAGFDLAQAVESLGMRLVTSLAVQLGAELTTGSAEPGARFSLVLPVKSAEP